MIRNDVSSRSESMNQHDEFNDDDSNSDYYGQESED